jgi:molecular chaperone DnaK
MNFGIDFGTTNTAISRMDGDEPVALTFGPADQQHHYVPSVMALRGGLRPSEQYGHAAKDRVGEPGFEVYQNFKMLLGEPPARVAAHWGGGLSQTPEAITQRFIARLLEQMKTEHGLRPARVVVTVPEVWLVQNLQTKREHLIEGFKRQGIGRVEVRSEPVAAATYYLHSFKKKKGHPFQGHLLVCDCGGGTLDFCLVGVEPGAAGRPRMTVLERAGNGIVNGRIGSAGVAFDQAVVDRLFPGLRGRDPERYFRRVREFEQHKITHSPAVSENLALHRETPEAAEGERLFSLDDGEVSVEPQHLAEAFAAVSESAIREALDDLLARIRTHAVALEDPSKFRVLMVGGFSSFWLVSAAIKDAFGRVLSTDLRFEEVLSLADRALAISKGAALLANDLAEIVETCPADVGVQGFVQDKDGGLQRVRFAILRKTVRIRDYRQPVWSSQAFLVVSTEIRLPVYVEPIPDKPLPLEIGGETLQAILPAGLGVGSRIEIGFSVDQNLVFSIHVRDAKNKSQEKTTTLGNVMARLPALIVD